MADDNLELLKAQVEEWSTNSNECTKIELLRGDGQVTASFSPDFTYPIFGEEEAIFGYRDLKLTLSFAAHNLRPHLNIDYRKAFPAEGDVRPTDIKEAFADFLPSEAFDEGLREEALKDDHAAEFRPPGDKVHEYQRNGKRFEIWSASLENDDAKALLENIQILMVMFIEGGSILQLEQDWTTERWKVFFIYLVDDTVSRASPYSLVGYGTSYRIFTFADRKITGNISAASTGNPESFEEWLSVEQKTSPLNLESRERLSQFLILPPYHHAGHGGELYDTMYRCLAGPDNVKEFTVEDPNESFDNLRDIRDLLMLRRRPDFAALRIVSNIAPEKLKNNVPIPIELIVPESTRNQILKETKLMQRQFDRLVEMHTLSFIPQANRSRARITRKEKSSNENDRAYYFWRLYVKQRLYVFNRDQLAQLERDERVEKLEAALDSVQEGYAEILESVEKRESTRGEEEIVTGSNASKRVGKRKVIDEDEDDEEEEEDEDDVHMYEDGSSVNGSKKARVK